MNKYRLLWGTLALGIPWQYDFHMPSDDAAKAYAKDVMETDMGCRMGAMSLMLWRMSDDTMLCELVLDKPIARDRIWRK